ncbi:hypothetical protein OHQ89_51230 [Streptomyces canus]|uniref:hypothetical protein n=1 Tax=Streptomyces canus TaxID=58343 RepID=UPI0030DFE700
MQQPVVTGQPMPSTFAGQTGSQQTRAAYLATTVTKPVVLGEGHITFGWVISNTGRKHMVGSAIATRDGELCACSTALWLTLPRRTTWQVPVEEDGSSVPYGVLVSE